MNSKKNKIDVNQGEFEKFCFSSVIRDEMQPSYDWKFNDNLPIKNTGFFKEAVLRWYPVIFFLVKIRGFFLFLENI